MIYKLELYIEGNPWGQRCRTCPLCVYDPFDLYCTATDEIASHGGDEKTITDAYAYLEDKCPLEVIA